MYVQSADVSWGGLLKEAEAEENKNGRTNSSTSPAIIAEAAEEGERTKINSTAAKPTGDGQ